MGTYVKNNKVSIGTAYDYDDVVAEVAGLLAVGTRSDGRYHLADVCQAGSINPLARCKPFRYKAYFFASSAERAEIRGRKATNASDNAPNNGFGTTPTVYVANGEITHGVYEYKKPTGTEDAPNRLLDFDGYNHLAVSPINIKFGTPYNDSNTGVEILFHDTSKGWDADSCLRIEDLLDAYSADEYLALLIVGGGNSWLLPSTVKAKDIVNNSLTPVVITFGVDAPSLQGNANLVQGSYLMDSLYSAIAEDTDMHMAIVTSHTAPPAIDSTIGVRRPLAGTGDFGSLEFSYGSDRDTIKMSAWETIKGLTGGLRNINWGSISATSGPDSSWMYHYINNLSAELYIKTPAEWHRKSVYIEAEISNQYGYFLNNQNQQVAPIIRVQIPNPASVLPMPANTEYAVSGFLSEIANYKAVTVGNVSNVKGPGLRIVIKAYRSEGLKNKESITLYDGIHNY